MTLIRKRKLTHQQNRRIARQQQQRTDEVDSGQLEGLIIAHHGRQLEVLALDAPAADSQLPPEIEPGQPVPFWRPVVQGDSWRCHARTNLPLLVTGDRVRWQPDPNTGLGLISALHERRSLLSRPDRYQKLKPVAANVSLIVIVFAVEPVPSASLIDRYLVACHQAAIPCVLVLNKTDLLGASPESLAARWLTDYAALGYETLSVSVSAPATLSALRQRLQQEQAVLVGQSGVGKSSLVNALLPQADQPVNVISENSLLGQHTTTTTRLLPLCASEPLAGALIDSPGIREFGLWHLNADAIRAGFTDLQQVEAPCRFRNCTHRQEPGCALHQAVQDGLILQRRLDSLHQLLDEAAAQGEIASGS